MTTTHYANVKFQKKKILAYIGMKNNMEIGTVNGILWINGYEGVTYIWETRLFLADYVSYRLLGEFPRSFREFQKASIC